MIEEELNKGRDGKTNEKKGKDIENRETVKVKKREQK